MTALKKQQGWSFTSLLAVLFVAGVFLTVGFKLAPAYYDHRTLQSIMTDTVADRALLSKKKSEIRISILNRLRLNNMRDLPKDFFKIEKDKGTVIFNIDYEMRIPIFMNVDAIVYFKEQYEGQELE